MIQKVQAFSIGGAGEHQKVFATIEEAQRAALNELIGDGGLLGDSDCLIPDWVLENKGAILDILTTTPNSKPSARKINGGTKRRRPSIPSPQTARALNSEKAE